MIIWRAGRGQTHLPIRSRFRAACKFALACKTFALASLGGGSDQARLMEPCRERPWDQRKCRDARQTVL